MKLSLYLGLLAAVTGSYGLQQQAFINGKPTDDKNNKIHGRFLHLTDIHLDGHYEVGATVKSDCHFQPKQDSNSMVAGYWGAPITDCDSAPLFVSHSLKYIAAEWKDKIDFVLWTGDNARHDSDYAIVRTLDEIIGYNMNITNLLRDAFTLDDERRVPIVPCIGNNDVHPHNQLRGIPKNPQLINFSKIWKDFIPKDQLDIFKGGGYFAVDVVPGIRVLALNTLYFFASNDIVNGCNDRKGPGHRHLKWMKDELKRAQGEGVKVIMIGHVPPTVKTFKDSCLESYIDISSKYKDIIIGHMYGHSNKDHFQILGNSLTGGVNGKYEEEDDDIASIMRKADRFITTLKHQYKKVSKLREREDLIVVHIAPPMLPIFYPTFRINEYETDNSNSAYGNWLSYTQWYSNLTYWNEVTDSAPDDEITPVFEIEYSTNGTYGMPDLTRESWLDFAEKLSLKEDKTLWRKYKTHLFVSTNDQWYDGDSVISWWDWMKSFF